MRNGVCWLVLLVGAGSCLRPSNPSYEGSKDRGLVLASGITAVRTVEQNWSDSEAERYYDSPQGSKMMPYAWFLHLEQADSEKSFLDAANIRAIGYLPRKPNPKGNPDGLPIGFTKDGESLGLTCAACHTAQIDFGTTSFVIDGGPALADAERLLRSLEQSLRATHDDAAKFDRFATAVLGPSGGADSKTKLKAELEKVLAARAGYDTRNLPHAGEPPFGPGRIDAFGAIMNEVAVRFAQVPDNETRADAPVSYPMLWDTPQHDRVQWNGAAENSTDPAAKLLIGSEHIGAFGRNVGEVLGVFGDVDTSKDKGVLDGYPSSINRDELLALEELLTKLWSPQWPSEFGGIDDALKEKGRTLYAQNCASCHVIIDRKDPNRRIVAMMDSVGTDPRMAENFAIRTAKSGVLAGRKTLVGLLSKPRVLGAEEPISDLLEHVGQRVVFGESLALAFVGDVKALKYDIHAKIRVDDEHFLHGAFSKVEMRAGKLIGLQAKRLTGLAGKQKVDVKPEDDLSHAAAALKQTFTMKRQVDPAAGASIELTPEAGAQPAIELEYKARPLNGIWATAPYLHNGSVGTLDDLLKPAAARRPFRVGSRQFDSKLVGYQDAGAFVLDPSAVGNSNAGHEYGDKIFTDEERRALVEFLKSL